MLLGSRTASISSMSTLALCSLAIGVGAMLTATLAVAQDAYPSRPVRLVIPFPPGSSDTVARLLAERLSKSLKQPFVIENRPGASGTLGTGTVARAAPDGYTLVFPTCAHAVSAVAFKSLPYDSVNDFAPVARVANSPMVLVASPKFPAQNVQGFIDLAKAKPGTLNYASNGAGSITSLAMLMLKSMTRADIADIPYKGAGPSLTALMGNEVDVMIAPLGAVSAFVDAGKLKALAIASPQRSRQVPQLPTIAESGVPGFEATCWYGVLAPKGTPPQIISLLNREIVASLATPELRSHLTTLGIEAAPSTPAEFGEYIQSEINKWGKVFKESGLVQE